MRIFLIEISLIFLSNNKKNIHTIFITHITMKHILDFKENDESMNCNLIIS